MDQDQIAAAELLHELAEALQAAYGYLEMTKRQLSRTSDTQTGADNIERVEAQLLRAMEAYRGLSRCLGQR